MTDTTPVLSRSVTAELEYLDDNGNFLPGLIRQFELDIAQAISEARLHQSSSNLRHFRHACHAIKSLAGHLGAARLSDAGGRGMSFDDACLSQRNIQPWFEEVEQERGFALQAMHEWLAKLGLEQLNSD